MAFHSKNNGACRACGKGEKRREISKKNNSACLSMWRKNIITCYHRVNKQAALICGGILVGCSVLVRAIGGSPWGSRASLQLGERMPSVLWMTLLWCAWYFALGCVFGAVTFSGEQRCVISLRSLEKYRGGMFFLTMILLGYLWYPLFFASARFALAAVVCVLVTLLAFLGGASYWKISRLAGSVLFVHGVFLFFLSTWSVLLLFRL